MSKRDQTTCSNQFAVSDLYTVRLVYEFEDVCPCHVLRNMSAIMHHIPVQDKYYYVEQKQKYSAARNKKNRQKNVLIIRI